MKAEELKEQNTAWMCRCIGTYKILFLLKHTNTHKHIHLSQCALSCSFIKFHPHVLSPSLLYVINQRCAVHPSSYFMFIFLYQQPTSSMSITVNDILHFPERLLTFPGDRACFCRIELRVCRRTVEKVRKVMVCLPVILRNRNISIYAKTQTGPCLAWLLSVVPVCVGFYTLSGPSSSSVHLQLNNVIIIDAYCLIITLLTCWRLAGNHGHHECAPAPFAYFVDSWTDAQV